MLPDVSSRNKLWGIDRSNYDSGMLHQIIKLKSCDGYTTPNATPIIRGINDYLEESRYLVIQCSVMFQMLKKIESGTIEKEGSVLLTTYCDNIDAELLKQSYYNIMKMIKSVASQRKLMIAVKKVLKKNCISKDWEKLIRSQIDSLNERLAYLKKIPIPGNLAYTPLGAYADYLTAQGTDIYQDIASFVENDGSLFDDDGLDSARLYTEHVVQVLRGLGEEEARNLLKTSLEAFERRKMRQEKMRKLSEEEKAEKIRQGAERAKTNVLHCCSIAGKVFCRERRNSLMSCAKSHSYVWVVACARAESENCGYAQRGAEGKIYITPAIRARIFKSEREAQAVAEEYRKQGKNNFAEVAMIDLFTYAMSCSIYEI